MMPPFFIDPEGRLVGAPVKNSVYLDDMENTAKLVKHHYEEVLNRTFDGLGWFQALLLQTMVDLGGRATADNVKEVLVQMGEVEGDIHAQVYSLMGKLAAAGHIGLVGEEVRGGRGRAPRVYEVTSSGKAALRRTAEHYRAVAALLGTEQR